MSPKNIKSKIGEIEKAKKDLEKMMRAALASEVIPALNARLAPKYHVYERGISINTEGDYSAELDLKNCRGETFNRHTNEEQEDAHIGNEYTRDTHMIMRMIMGRTSSTLRKFEKKYGFSIYFHGCRLSEPSPPSHLPHY